MADSTTTATQAGNSPPVTPPTVIVQTDSGRKRGWWTRLLMLGLGISVMFNMALYSAYHGYFEETTSPLERYHSGDKLASDKIAVVNINGTIMPPYTERYLKMIKRAKEDDNVKGVLLAVDSPGGLVADSHQIYYKLLDLSAAKPVFVAMKRLAASGGLYVAMGAGLDGRIYAEPTTWTGSIGVIIPRFDLTQLSEKIGVDSAPLKTGPFKDALSPFRELTEEERQLWMTILDDSFNRFITVIADNRKDLDEDGVRQLATGQVFTAEQAKSNRLIDEIGYEEDAIAALQKQLGLEDVRIVTYKYQSTLIDVLAGTAEAQQPERAWQSLLDATVPRAMYYFSWSPGIPLR